MSKVMRSAFLVTILLMLAVFASLVFSNIGSASAATRQPYSEAVEAQAAGERVEPAVQRISESEQVGHSSFGGTLYRFDDWERGNTCYQVSNGLSCVPMNQSMMDLRKHL